MCRSQLNWSQAVHQMRALTFCVHQDHRICTVRVFSARAPHIVLGGSELGLLSPEHCQCSWSCTRVHKPKLIRVYCIWYMVYGIWYMYCVLCNAKHHCIVWFDLYYSTQHVLHQWLHARLLCIHGTCACQAAHCVIPYHGCDVASSGPMTPLCCIRL